VPAELLSGRLRASVVPERQADRLLKGHRWGVIVGLFVMRTNGTHTRQVTEKTTPTRYEDRAPQWSPDGGRLVFQRFNKGTGLFAVFTVHLDGTHDRRLTPGTWEPEGTRTGHRTVVGSFSDSHIEDGMPRDVCVVHPNGTDLHCLTHATATTSFLPCGILTGRNHDHDSHGSQRWRESGHLRDERRRH
jgi:Periplasmic component of the Tol biopolymer transport system